jgi:hypothetical protein
LLIIRESASELFRGSFRSCFDGTRGQAGSEQGGCGWFDNTEVKTSFKVDMGNGHGGKGSLLGISFSRVFDNKVFHLGVNLLGRYLQVVKLFV